MSDTWVEAIGWAGSILVVVSLTQSRVLRFRWLNLIGSLLATFYNAWAGIWPFVVMNGAISLINVYWLVRLNRERHDAAVYEVVPVTPDDAYLHRVLDVHAGDIAATHPRFARTALDAGGRRAWLVVRGDETVGVVVVRGEGADAVVELDWVTPRFRDFTPGEFVYRRSGIFSDLGFTRVVVDAPPADQRAYLERVGFRPVPDGAAWARAVG